MEYSIEVIIFYLLLLDALVVNVLAWGGAQLWWRTRFRAVATWLPLSRGWTTYYLVLVLLLGIVLYRAGVLVIPF